jgi:hypothetical protein
MPHVKPMCVLHSPMILYKERQILDVTPQLFLNRDTLGQFYSMKDLLNEL